MRIATVTRENAAICMYVCACLSNQPFEKKSLAVEQGESLNRFVTATGLDTSVEFLSRFSLVKLVCLIEIAKLGDLVTSFLSYWECEAPVGSANINGIGMCDWSRGAVILSQ